MPKISAVKNKTMSGQQGAKVPVFEAKVLDLSKIASIKPKLGSVVVGVYQDGTLSAAAQIINKITDGAIESAQNLGDITGKKATVTVFHQLSGLNNIRVVVVGLGKVDDLNAKTYLSAVHAAAKTVTKLPEAVCVWALHEIAVAERSEQWASAQAAQSFVGAGYKFDQCKGVAAQSEPSAEALGPSEVFFISIKGALKQLQAGLQMGLSIGLGSNLAKDLGNLPGNICTPNYLAETAKKIAKQYKLEVEVLGQRQMQALGMGSLLSVAKGSVEPPKLIVLKYLQGGSKAAPIVLVGKGITFDTGGISLKPGAEMDEMKFDMCGAASVLGTIKAIAELKLNINVIGVVPTCENMPAGNASKPGDVVTSMSGQTIEILNTDAEGRLILCDALTFSERFKPAAVIDVATLTGACVIALGSVNSGLFSKDEALVSELSSAGHMAADPVWRLPLDEEYHEQLKSNFADIANIGGRMAGSVTAACFLSKFTKAYPWAHLDIAGTAWKSGASKGSSGRPVPLLVNFLQGRAK